MDSTKENFPCKQEEVDASPKTANESVSETPPSPKTADESVSENPPSPKTANESVSETPPSPRVVLNPADCDLDFNIECDGVIGYGLHEEGFSYCWSGARANVGITRGRYCFGCNIVSEQPVVMNDIPREKKHLLRVGFSRGDEEVGSLGESKNSFSFGGKIPNDGLYLTFWTAFDVGETIVCCIDLESKPKATVTFFQSGLSLGTLHQFDAARLLGLGGVNSPPPGSLPWRSAVFPHVVLRNIMVEMQFSVEDGLVPVEGFKPWALAVADGNGVMGPILSQKTDCEVIMMVGLPASGKTMWAEKIVNDCPEKRYVLLGINSILDRIKIPGPPRRNHDDDDDGMFYYWMERATEIFDSMLSLAGTIPRNYIIDQRNNVYLNTRKDVLKPFDDCFKMAVVVFPKPSDLFMRSENRFKETGKAEPSNHVKDMIANFVLPKRNDMPDTDEYFDQVIFVELNRDESQIYLDQMKQDLASSSTNNENVSKLKSLEL